MPSKKTVTKKPAPKKVAAKPVPDRVAPKKAAIKSAPAKKVAVKKAPAKKTAAKAVKTPAKKVVKAAPAKKVAVKKAASAKKLAKAPASKAPASKVPSKKAPVKKASAKKATDGGASASKDSSKFSVQPRILLEEKAEQKGETIESLIKERKVDLKSVEEYLGVPQKVDFHKKPIIPGLFDLLIPPGTPRKLIVKLAKEHNAQIVRRDDVYVPVGVSDIERDLLAFRGDKKTIQKMEKLLKQEIVSFITGNDARLHDPKNNVKLEGISYEEKPFIAEIEKPARKPAKKSAKAKVKPKAKK